MVGTTEAFPGYALTGGESIVSGALGLPLGAVLTRVVSVPLGAVASASGVRNRLSLQPFPIRGARHVWSADPFLDLSRLGERGVRERDLEAGNDSRHWDGTSDAGMALPGGIYFIRLACLGSSVTQRVVLMR